MKLFSIMNTPNLKPSTMTVRPRGIPQESVGFFANLHLVSTVKKKARPLKTGQMRLLH